MLFFVLGLFSFTFSQLKQWVTFKTKINATSLHRKFFAPMQKKITHNTTLGSQRGWQADFVAEPCKCQKLTIFEFYLEKIKALNITKRWVQKKRMLKMKNWITLHMQCLTVFRKTFCKILQDAMLLGITLQRLQAYKCTTIHNNNCLRQSNAK